VGRRTAAAEVAAEWEDRVPFSEPATSIQPRERVMKDKVRSAMAFITAVVLSLNAASPTSAQTSSTPPGPPPKEKVVTAHASGTFEVKLTPQPTDTAESLGRMSMAKQFQGDLEGVSAGQMLTAGTAVKGSAGYVAIERVTGTLKGRRGSFMLQHNGTLNRGAPQLTISVVPDSGTDELAGLAGTMAIIIESGKHSFTFDYTLPGTQ
jgi:hypothetical protein